MRSGNGYSAVGIGGFFLRQNGAVSLIMDHSVSPGFLERLVAGIPNTGRGDKGNRTKEWESMGSTRTTLKDRPASLWWRDFFLTYEGTQYVSYPQDEISTPEYKPGNSKGQVFK